VPLLLHDRRAVVAGGGEGLAVEPGVVLRIKSRDDLGRLSAAYHSADRQNPSVMHQCQWYAEAWYLERRLVNDIQICIDGTHGRCQDEVSLILCFVYTTNHVDRIVALQLACGEHGRNRLLVHLWSELELLTEENAFLFLK